MTKEQVLGKWPIIPNKSGTELYTKRNDALAAMDEYAKQQSLEFDKWKWENRWFSFENGYWYQTHEQGTAMSQATYNKHHRKTPEQLYELYIKECGR